MKLARKPEAIIYDLDGVLLDTEPVYTVVTREIVGRYGKTFDWSIKRHMIGRPSIEAARYLVQTLELPISPEAYLEARKQGLADRFPHADAKPGAEAFSRAAGRIGLPQAIATSSERAMYELKISRRGDWFSIFDSVVTGDEERVVNGKPAPDIFLCAADDLKIKPAACLVFEDSPSGVDAALAAGMQVVAMPDPMMSSEPVAHATSVVSGFEAFSASDFQQS